MTRNPEDLVPVSILYYLVQKRETGNSNDKYKSWNASETPFEFWRSFMKAHKTIYHTHAYAHEIIRTYFKFCWCCWLWNP